jgi:iron-sulfur cluster repair protein YtfE (RIC family)
MTSCITSIDPTISVNELLRRCPSVLPALNALGIDSCCGGAESLTDAARRAGISLEALVAGIGPLVQRRSST